MRKYLGSKISAYCAIVYPCFIVGPLIFSGIMLSSEISAATVFLFILCTLCSVLCCIYGFSYHLLTQFYSWGKFGESSVQIRNIFGRKYEIKYSDCRSIGIGSYHHGVLNSGLGSTTYYIFLSSDYFEEKYRTRMNLWKPTSERIKVAFDQNLYEHLLNVLPKKQAISLRRDYDIYYRSDTA